MEWRRFNVYVGILVYVPSLLLLTDPSKLQGTEVEFVSPKKAKIFVNCNLAIMNFMIFESICKFKGRRGHYQHAM